MKSVSRKAYAKVNLSLDVLRRRPDGYHEVKMIMQSVGIYDELNFEILEAEEDFKAGDYPDCEGMIALSFIDLPENIDLGPVEKNLIYRAAKMIYDRYNLKDKIRISLKKNIPVAAGMAGGSTDGAAVFHGLNELFKLNMTTEEMCELGVKLGADIPFCIMGGTYLSEGIGEVLTKIPTPPSCVLLVAKPDISVSTKFVYENLHANELKVHPDVSTMLEAISEKNLMRMSQLLGNVLENVSCKEYPIIEEIKDLMKNEGALNSLMSGSGPTVFGIFTPDESGQEKARAAMDRIKEEGLSKQVFITEFV